MRQNKPRVVVFSTLFPNTLQPTAGVFIRERMFRVAQHLPLIVVAPQPWFPLQRLIRLWKPHFRPPMPLLENQQDILVYHPRFLSLPGMFKSWDGILLALSLYPFMKRLRKEFKYDIIDAHFGYPDGYAATKLGRWLNCPVTITMRGTEVRHANDTKLQSLLIDALTRADRVFSVSDSLRQLALGFGIDPDKASVMANGVDVEKFQAVDKTEAREKFRLPSDARVMITVGGLVERKGFHRVLEVLPELLQSYPDLHYLIVGGASAEGDWSEKLKAMVNESGLEKHVHFLGVIPPDELKWALSAADLFVLSTRNEGWANVLLEAMACGVPVVATDVGGNAEVVARKSLGSIVPFDQRDALQDAIATALAYQWNRDEIIAYAQDNCWEKRVKLLVESFVQLHQASSLVDSAASRTGNA